ncbi:hypothetical protein J2785_002661 [Burkholderia ambifaria]|nr:hypothetical protein [Burkholderia ambifaria]MDR6499505.1 hypothetical protein [Burkholderia ambifaria]
MDAAQALPIAPAHERDGVMVFIGIIDAVVEAAVHDGIVQCSVAAGTVAPTSNVD